MRVSYWSLSRPIRVSNGISYTSLTAGKDGISAIDVLPGGLVVVERDSAPSVLLTPDGAYGELTAEEDAGRKARASSSLETAKKPAAGNAKSSARAEG